MGYNFIGDGDILQRFRRGRQRRHWRKIHKGRDRPKLITIDEEKKEGGRLDMAFMAAIGTRARKGNHRFYHHRKRKKKKKGDGKKAESAEPGLDTEQTFTEVMKEKGVRMHTRSMRTGSRPTESGNDKTMTTLRRYYCTHRMCGSGRGCCRRCSFILYEPAG